MHKQVARIYVAHQIREVFIPLKVRFLGPLQVTDLNILRVLLKVFILKPELEPNVQERSLKAFLDLAILCALTEHPMTGYEINRLFLKKHRIFVGPSTVYSKLVSIERKGWIAGVKNRTGKVYGLTEQGKKITMQMADITKEIQDFLKIILKCHYTPNSET
jgi:DNA-binding PadR family transcriptional regulator